MSVVVDLWIELGDIPIDEDENIEIPFHEFPAGTNKYEIWHWFEEEFDIVPGDGFEKWSGEKFKYG